jgi:hypothetical protein
MGMKATLLLLAVCVLLGTGNGVLIGYLSMDRVDSVVQPDPDEDEVICRETTTDIVGNHMDNSDMERRRLAVVLYEGCIKERHDAHQNARDSLEAEYLEKLQDCNERTQEAYDSWMACAYPNRVELEEGAHAHNDEGRNVDAGDM